MAPVLPKANAFGLNAAPPSGDAFIVDEKLLAPKACGLAVFIDVVFVLNKVVLFGIALNENGAAEKLGCFTSMFVFVLLALPKTNDGFLGAGVVFCDEIADIPPPSGLFVFD